MNFWAYMLHCRGGYFYAGHTDNLEVRVAQHRTGAIGFTADHRPVELVWSQEFSTREEAKEAERRIKGWSRAKKLALIRADWDKISMLAKAEGSPSTGSGKRGLGKNRSKNSVRPELVEGLSFTLVPHPLACAKLVKSVTAQVERLPDASLLLRYDVRPAASLVLPDRAMPWRRDELWKSTCFELFVMPDLQAAYTEFNFAPHLSWNAYTFSDWRRGMARMDAQSDPHLVDSRLDDRASDFPHAYQLDVILGPETLPKQPARMSLTAVIEETNGTKSYWALAHPDGPPDFHDRACFVARLPE